MQVDRHLYGSGVDHIRTTDELMAEMTVVHSMEARYATQRGDLDLLKQLLDDERATVHDVDADDCSLLHWAAINNRLGIARLLIERGADVNALGGVLVSTPLHWAARHGLGEMVALLVRCGADFNRKDGEGFTPLHIAVQSGCTAVAAFFIAAGQSPDAADDAQMTPAMWAAHKVPYVFPLRMLAMMGADLERHDATFGNTALHWAVVQSNHVAINTLLRLDVNPQPLNKAKETPLDIARRRNDLLAIRLLELRLRECGLAPSTWRQRLREDKCLTRWMLLASPFSAIFGSTAICDSALDYVSKTELLALIAIGTGFTFRYFLRPRQSRDVNCQHLLTGCVLAAKAFLIIGWLLFLHAVVPPPLQAGFLALAVAVPLLYYQLGVSEPGHVAAATQKERNDVVLEVTASGDFDNFCSHCMVMKRHGTKHCRICGKCIRMFDHHCPWLGKCIGAGNHRLFVGYLALLNLSTLLIFIGGFYYWREMCDQLTAENLLFCRPAVLVIQFMAFSFFVWTSVMNCVQSYELFYRWMAVRLTVSGRCSRFNIAGGKLNVRSPFSRRCLLLRRICALFCCASAARDPDNLYADDFLGDDSLVDAAPMSVRVAPRSGSKFVLSGGVLPDPRTKEATPLL